MNRYKPVFIFITLSLGSYMVNQFIGSQLGEIGQAIFQLIFIITGAYSALLALAILMKQRKVARLIGNIANNDPAWLKQHLEMRSRDILYRILHAWDKADTSIIEAYVTPTFLEHFRSEVKFNYEGHERVDISYIDIKETSIIGCEDHPDNDSDKYSVIIRGSIKWHYQDHSRQPVLRTFSEMYYFIRSKNGWLLDNATGNPSLIDVLMQRVYTHS